MTASVRAAALMRFGDQTRKAGLDPQRLLREVDLPSRALTDPDVRIPVDKVAAVLELAAERSGDPSFGLRMAESRQLADYGALGLLIGHQPSVRAVLATMAEYRHLLNEALALHVEESGDLAILREEQAIEAARPPRQAHELALGTLCQTIRALLGKAWQPLSAHFTHAAPPDLSVHRRMFGPRLVFDSEFNGVVCAISDLDRPNPAAEPGLARYARQFVRTLPHAERQSTTQEVRKAIYLLLPLGRASIVGVADALGLQVRRLQRRLADEGSEFQTLLAGVRRDLAVRYLSSARYSLTEIAALLGYTQLSSFSRWFTGEFGVSPGVWRKQSSETPSVRGGKQ